MENDILQIKLQEIQKVHEKIAPCFQLPNVDNDLKKEYRNKTAQYENMLQSVELMKAEVETADAVEGLINQQLSIIKKWVAFEFEMVKKL